MNIKNYLTFLYQCTEKYGHDYSYQQTDEALYIGINAKRENKIIDHYEPGAVGNWAQFSSCTTSDVIAK